MLFSPVFISTEPVTMLARLPCLPRASRGAPMGYAVLPTPSLASGTQALLLSKLKAPINHAESTLLQVFFLKNLKPFGINTFEKQGEGSPLWLTNCSKRVSIGRARWNPNFPNFRTYSLQWEDHGEREDPLLLGTGDRIEESMGATRFRRKLSRPEGMPGSSCP